jgi:hypothetical protein
MPTFIRPRLVAAALLVALAAGCGGGSGPRAEVHGKVLYNGGLVTAGNVQFHPESGGPAVSAAAGGDGLYRVTGLTPGRYKVAIETRLFKNLAPPPKALGKITTGRPVYVPIPDRYEKAESSGLTYEVQSGDNAWDIELK